MTDYKAAFEQAMETLRDIARARELGWTKAADCEQVAQMVVDAIEVTYDLPAKAALPPCPLCGKTGSHTHVSGPFGMN